MFKAVIFDLDGTVVDTLDDLTFAMNSMLSHFGYPERTRDEIRSFLGNGQKVFVTRSLPQYARDEHNVNRCSDYYEKLYAENTVRFSKPFDSVPILLERLKVCGTYVALLTNKNQEHASRIIQTLFGNSLFDIVVGAGKFKRKPDPEAALYIAKELGVFPCECAFVGDSDVDIETARNAGMYAVGVSWGYCDTATIEESSPHKIADNATELARILEIKIK